MLEKFEKSWPERFYSTISKKVETMAASCKLVQIGESNVCNLNAIYSRDIALLASDLDIYLNDVFSYERGCDTTSYFCIGKGTVIKTLKDCHDSSAIGNRAAPLEEVIQRATRFIPACYGMK
jgi:hypothetical protein